MYLALDIVGVLAAGACAVFFGRALWANGHLLGPDEPRYADPELRRLLGRSDLSEADLADAKSRRARLVLALVASLAWFVIAAAFLVRRLG